MIESVQVQKNEMEIGKGKEVSQKRNHMIHFRRPFSKEQLFTILSCIFQTLTFIYSIAPRLYDRFEISGILFLLSHFVLTLFLLHDYYRLGKLDPTDKLLLGLQKPVDFPPQKLLFCLLCDKLVKKSSYHCWRCGKCTEDFDHHCKYLNCCIGAANYELFLRMVLLYAIFCGNCLAEISLVEIGVIEGIYGGLALCLGVLMSILFGFHCYLNIFLKKSTYQYLQSTLSLQSEEQLGAAPSSQVRIET